MANFLIKYTKTLRIQNRKLKMSRTIKACAILVLTVILQLTLSQNAKAQTTHDVSTIGELNTAIAAINSTPNVLGDTINLTADILTGGTDIASLLNPATIIANTFTVDGSSTGSLFSFSAATTIVDFSDSITIQNGSSDLGGAVTLVSGATMDFTNSSSTILFDTNSATGSGGAVDLKADGTTFTTAADTTFINNTAGENGGALAMGTSADFFATGDLTFTNNTATTGSGGAVLLLMPGTTFTADASATFIGNTAGDAGDVLGGAVSMVYGTTMDFTDSASTVLFDTNSTTG